MVMMVQQRSPVMVKPGAIYCGYMVLLVTECPRIKSLFYINNASFQVKVKQEFHIRHKTKVSPLFLVLD